MLWSKKKNPPEQVSGTCGKKSCTCTLISGYGHGLPTPAELETVLENLAETVFNSAKVVAKTREVKEETAPFSLDALLKIKELPKADLEVGSKIYIPEIGSIRTPIAGMPVPAPNLTRPVLPVTLNAAFNFQFNPESCQDSGCLCLYSVREANGFTYDILVTHNEAIVTGQISQLLLEQAVVSSEVILNTLISSMANKAHIEEADRSYDKTFDAEIIRAELEEQDWY